MKRQARPVCISYWPFRCFFMLQFFSLPSNPPKPDFPPSIKPLYQHSCSCRGCPELLSRTALLDMPLCPATISLAALYPMYPSIASCLFPSSSISSARYPLLHFAPLPVHAGIFLLLPHPFPFLSFPFNPFAQQNPISTADSATRTKSLQKRRQTPSILVRPGRSLPSATPSQTSRPRKSPILHLTTPIEPVLLYPPDSFGHCLTNAFMYICTKYVKSALGG